MCNIHIRNICVLLFLFSVMGCGQKSSGNVLSGVDVLQSQNFSVLQGKRVGLITNQTGVNRELESTIDLLYHAEDVELLALFGPEHGVRGNYPAGANVRDYRDEMTGLPVYSLYGTTRKPTTEMLRGLDVLVFDIQDIGVRSYTYLSTMRLAMEAAADQGIAFMVLDRPNPLGGNRVEGFPAPQENDHFISPWFVPYVHGMTLGEIATMINEEAWLGDGRKADLSIIPMKNWNREMLFADTGLHWVPTSPHIPQAEVAAYYAALGLAGELDVINIGIGYTLPFQLFGAPWISPKVFAERMNAWNLPGVQFRPTSWKPFYGPHKDQTQHGVHILLDADTDTNLFALQFLLMHTHDIIYPQHTILEKAGRSRIQMFDLVAGGTWAKEMLTESFSLRVYEETEQEKRREFMEIRKRYKRY